MNDQEMVQRMNYYLTCDKGQLAIMLAAIEKRMPKIIKALTEGKDIMASAAQAVVILENLKKL